KGIALEQQTRMIFPIGHPCPQVAHTNRSFKGKSQLKGLVWLQQIEHRSLALDSAQRMFVSGGACVDDGHHPVFAYFRNHTDAIELSCNIDINQYSVRF